MKRMLIVVCVCVLSVGLAGGMAQDKGKETNESLIERKYDRFKDETMVKLRPQKIREIAKPREELSLSVEAMHKGERAVRPKDVFLIFNSESEEYLYHNKAEVLFIVDGKRIEAGQAYLMSASPTSNLEKVTLKLTISFDRFSEIANGKSVELRLRKTEVTLTGATMAAMRAFANAVKGESKGG
ncbi:MAG: hypothetical protein HONDAALG_01689 [Gammaproteobacteria bacterium]|nr:hypothetical protein [Gammaproteobacteria bacterium]